MLGAHSEKRAAPRRRVLKGAYIAYQDRHCTLECTVRDLSAGGARLEVRGAMHAPDAFLLVIELDGIEADCEVIRRTSSELAVKFMSPPRAVPAKRSQVVHASSRTPSLRRQPAADGTREGLSQSKN